MAVQEQHWTRAALEPFRHGKTILLKTFKRDGTAVGTPVNIAFVGDRAFFRTWDTSWKAKRIRRTPDVEIAPSNVAGTPRGPAVEARARLLSGPDDEMARSVLKRSQPITHGIFVPLVHRLRRQHTVHYELLPR
jgi:PPOX class probable F420-dependent enzyme